MSDDATQNGELHSTVGSLGDGDDLEIATEEDLGIRRGDDGRLVPVKQRIPGTEKAVRVRPPVDGALEKYSDVFAMGRGGQDASDEKCAELLRAHVTEGIGADADTEWVRNTPDYLVAGVVQAIKNAGGYHVFLAVQEQRNEEMALDAKAARAMGFDADDLKQFANGDN